MGTLSVPTEHGLTTFWVSLRAALSHTRFPPTHRSSLYRSSLVGTVICSRQLLGNNTLSYRTMSPIRSPLPPHNITLRYVPRNSLKGAGSALGVQWVGGFSHGGGRVRRGLEWVCAMSCP